VFSSIILCSAPSFALVACAQHAETRFWATARSIRMLFPGPTFLFYDMSFFWRDVALYRQDMSLSSHAGQIGLGQIADKAQAPVVGVSSHWPSRSGRARHTHSRHQLMYSQKGVIHVSTPTGSWILPPTRSIWISGGTPHSLLVKRPVQLIILWVDRHAPGAPNWTGCNVVSVSPLIRELLSVCSEQPWDYPPASRSSRLAQVLLEQLQVHEQSPLELPKLNDPRAERVAAMLRADPADRRPLVELAASAGASHRTIERLFASEARMSFGRWRVRHRMISALEQLAHGDSVSNVAYAVGYETPSSFIAAFRDSFGTTPMAYFQDMHDRRASKE
jgi:AraC-like DNA-binding protein